MSLLGPRKAGRGPGGTSHHPLLIRTKLEPPAKVERILTRDRLYEFLINRPAWKVVAAHAPAGYGKSELLRGLKARLEEQDWCVGWVRLDREDNQPHRLLRYIEASLQQTGVLADSPESGSSGSRPEPVSLQLERLCARISSIEQDAMLVIDHAHELTAAEAWHCIETLVRYAPAQLRICIATRAPEFPGLGSLRCITELVEIDARSLSFRLDEIRQFLSQFEELKISADDCNHLYRISLGWPLGLQMLAHRLFESADLQAEIREASGGSGPFPDYFRQEVFDPLSPAQRKLILLIGIAGVAPVELISELRGSSVLPGEIEQLVSAGIFLIKDARPGWYRMHPLFCRFTEIEWREQDPEGLIEGHEKAALWFGSRGETQTAVQHAVLAGKQDLALGFVNQCLESCIDQAQFSPLSTWRGTFPENDLHRYPVLVLMMAWELAAQGRWLDAEVLASGVIEALTRKGRRKRQDNKENEIRRAIGVRACAGLMSGRDALLEDASQQWRKSDDGKTGETGIAMAALAQACLSNGDDALLSNRLQRAGALQVAHASALVGTLNDWVRSRTALEAGDLERAARLAAMSRSCLETEEVRCWTAGLLEMVVAMVDFERGQGQVPVDTAQDLITSDAPFVPALARSEAATLLAKQLFADLGLQAAREILQTARERLSDAADSFCCMRLDAEEVRLLLRNDQLEDAKQALRKQGWAARARSKATGFDAVYAEIAELTARLALAQNKPQDCLKLLGELQVMTPDWMTYRKARYLALEVLATDAAGQHEAAIEMLSSLLAEAAKVGLIQTFVEEGAPMGNLIGSLFPAQKIDSMEQGVYVNRLLKAFEADQSKKHPRKNHQPAPVESLTEREAEVLKMVAAGCSNREISKQLYLSLGTVKWHLHNVYDKLMVRNRTQAVNRARELDWM